MKPGHIILILIFGFSTLTSLSQAQTLEKEFRKLIAEGRTDEARTLILETKSDSPDLCLFIQGMLSEDADASLKYYNQLLREYPESNFGDFTLMLKAQLAYARGLYRSSLSLLEGLLENYEETPLREKSNYWMGLCHQALGKADSAAIYFKRAQANSQNSETYSLAESSLKTLRDTENKSNETGPLYHIQVGAFSVQDNALNRKAFFERRGYKVTFSQKTRNGTLLYLVWLGSFNTRDEARAFGESLKRKAIIKDYSLVSEQ